MTTFGTIGFILGTILAIVTLAASVLAHGKGMEGISWTLSCAAGILAGLTAWEAAACGTHPAFARCGGAVTACFAALLAADAIKRIKNSKREAAR